MIDKVKQIQEDFNCTLDQAIQIAWLTLASQLTEELIYVMQQQEQEEA